MLDVKTLRQVLGKMPDTAQVRAGLNPNTGRICLKVNMIVGQTVNRIMEIPIPKEATNCQTK